MGKKLVARIAPQFLRGRTIHLRPNWRRDLNHILCGDKRSFGDCLEPLVIPTQRVEHATQSVTSVPEIRKPFDALVEGIISKNSRGDKTAIGLFISGVSGWESRLRGILGLKSGVVVRNGQANLSAGLSEL